MAIPKKEDYVFYSGERFQVEFYFTQKGEMPAKVYFDKAPLNVRVKLAALVKYIAEHGGFLDVGKFRQVDPRRKIYEFKPAGHRFFSFFYQGGKVIITNAYMKKSQKVSKQDLGKAVAAKSDYIARHKGGIYYGKR